jgi:hypothetical protein
LQHFWLELTEATFDFFHRQFNLSGLEVRDVDLTILLKLLQFGGQHAGAQVFGNDSKTLFAI